MAEESSCKREFSGLPEDKKPPYLIKVGASVTNAGTLFSTIGYTGAVITGHAITLLTLLGLKDTSDIAMTNYLAELALCIAMMDKVYDGVDFVAQGDATIIAKAGINVASTNHASIGIPSTASGLVYKFATGAGEMFLSRETDKLALGSVTVTFTDPKIKVVKSGDTQLKVTCADGSFLFIDVETVINLLIQNQVEATKIMSVMALFNANGLSPVASPAPIVVPR